MTDPGFGPGAARMVLLVVSFRSAFRPAVQASPD